MGNMGIMTSGDVLKESNAIAKDYHQSKDSSRKHSWAISQSLFILKREAEMRGQKETYNNPLPELSYFLSTKLMKSKLLILTKFIENLYGKPLLPIS